MPISRATTAWVVSGAIGLTSFSVGMIASQAPTEATPPGPRPAITVTVDPSASPTVKPSTAKPTDKPTVKPSTAKPTASDTSSTPDTAPSPVTPPSPETPD